MIGALAGRLPPQATAADFVEKTDDTLTALADAEGDVSLQHQSSGGLHARIVYHGRVGWAGGRADAAADVLARATASATAGPPLSLMLPAPSPLPDVLIRGRSLAAAGSRELLALARGLRDRLAGRGRTVAAWAERSVGVVRVANTRGVMAEYATGCAGVGAVVSGGSISVATPLRVQLAETDLPGPGRLDELAATVDRWSRWPVVDDWPGGPTRALFLPDAVRTLLAPVLIRLAGERWCERGGPDTFALDERLTVIDDPLAPARPGSRPICDDGVPTRVLELVRRGRPIRGIIDLGTAARFGVPATGHGVRPALGAPRPGYSNVRVTPGDADAAGLRRALGTGVLVLDLPAGPAPNRSRGAFRAVAPWTFAVRDGEIVGRLDGAVLSGNTFEALRHVGAVGADAVWRGSWCLPSIVVEGVRLDLP